MNDKNNNTYNTNITTSTMPNEKSGDLVNKRDKKLYWRGLVIYQVYIHSFCDTAGKGYGDIKGITSKLDYIKSLNVDMVWITPFYPSPNYDFGYDVSNYCDVSPEYGTLQDFDKLIVAANKIGLRIMIDLVLSHTSIEHPWFEESRSSRTNPKADWYVWSDAKKDGSPPSNWLSIFGGVAWEWDTRRCQYYLHNFLKEQPDLNFHCEAVQNEMLNVVEFWLKRGVAGLRLDTVNFYFHDSFLTDNPAVPKSFVSGIAPMVNPYVFQEHLYDKSRPENIGFLRKFRKVCNKYQDIVTLGEVGDDLRSLEIIAMYTEGEEVLHSCYGFNFLTSDYSAKHFAYCLEIFRKKSEIHKGAYIAWSFSNHDIMRSISRLGLHKNGKLYHAKSLQHQLYAILAAAGGNCVIYQGEELALQEVDIPLEKMKDPYGIKLYPMYKGRDGCRTPMPWNSKEKNLGFSTSDETWLPIGKDRELYAVDVQEADKNSNLHVFRKFWEFYRGLNVLKYGSVWVGMEGEDPNWNVLSLSTGDQLLIVKRQLGEEEIQIIFNIGINPIEISRDVPVKIEVMYSANSELREDGTELHLDTYGFVFFREKKESA